MVDFIRFLTDHKRSDLCCTTLEIFPKLQAIQSRTNAIWALKLSIIPHMLGHISQAIFNMFDKQYIHM